MSRWVEGKVVRLKPWTDRLYSIQVTADIAPFVAGQFARLALEIDGEMVARPYSFLNSPADPLHEFYFITVPDGPLTHRLVRLAPGDPIFIAPRAAGFFTLNELPDADVLWMLSTGTAVGPFLSIMAAGEVWRRYPHVVLVHAVRTVDELGYRERILAHVQERPGQLQYIPFVSREVTDFAIRGRVPAAIGTGELEKRTGLFIDAKKSQVMICGNPDMVQDTVAVLQARGLQKNRRREPGQITTEQYWKS
ncbi:MAG TPA: ferredoxin--NADP reductase [Gammaproteobacteria bacterium]|nr:ferredoxin--NADP reductase [Gammaproteobacteria bacterium]